MFKILRTYFRRFMPYLLIAVLFTFLQVYAELKLPDLMSDIVDVGIVGRDVSYIVQVGVIMLGWALFSMVCIVGVSYCAAHAAMAFGRDVRQGVFHKVESFSTYEFDEFGTSSLITRATNDVQQIERLVQTLMSMALMAPFMFVGAAVMAWIKSPDLSMIIFGAIPIMLIFIIVMVKYGMPLLRSLQERIDKLNLVTRENLTGMRVIRAYNKEDAVEERFAEANSGLAETNVKVARLMGGLMPLIFLTINFAIVIIVWRGALGVYAGTLLVGDMMAIIQYATMVLFSIMMLSMMFAMLPRALAAGDRINEVLERLPDIRDDAQPDHIAGDIRGLLELEHVSFKFKDAEKPSICDVSVRFSPGETTAIIGSTGSGKSTLLNLIMRFYDPTEGRVLLDGRDIAHISQEDLHKRIAFVPQKVQLFSMTIAQNIRVGNADATDDEMIHAARVAQADGFIREKEDGYETMLSQGGRNLSGGQRQRLAIARALVRDAELVIFDDSFSALDFKTDSLVRTALKHEIRDATVIIVAQRVSAALDADKVIVLDEGRIVGVGTHAELIESCEVYREIAASQLDEDELVASCMPLSPNSSEGRGGNDGR